MQLLYRHRFITGRWGWELPAGAADPGEDPAAAAARELTEEAGVRCAALHPFGGADLSNGLSDQRVLLYRGTGITTGATMTYRGGGTVPARSAALGRMSGRRGPAAAGYSAWPVSSRSRAGSGWASVSGGRASMACAAVRVVSARALPPHRRSVRWRISVVVGECDPASGPAVAGRTGRPAWEGVVVS